jgi:hypothetical protein
MKRRQFLSTVVPLLLTVLLAMPVSIRAQDKDIPSDEKEKPFKIASDPKTPGKALLPQPPEATAVPRPWLVLEFAQVPQVYFEKIEAIKHEPAAKPKSRQERDQARAREEQARVKATEKITKFIVNINRLNEKGTDHFVKLLQANRDDLAGLPFVMGDACRQSAGRSAEFVTGVSLVRDSQRVETKSKAPPLLDPATEANKFWGGYRMQSALNKKRNAPLEADKNEVDPARIAALMQILAPEDKEFRKGLVKHLAKMDHAEATRALARLAIFSFDDEIRRPALEALKSRPSERYTEVLVAGLRYPWPAVARNAGEAIAQLECKDLIAQLVTMLDEPDPRAPADTVLNGKKTLAVREVVRVNHHRSCLMCHSPANANLRQPFQGGVENVGRFVTAPVPLPGVPFPTPSPGDFYGSQFSSPELHVRVDVTYLRQDFSMMQPVKDAAPWPEMQRFDFLVRTRAVTAEDAAAYRDWLRQQSPDYLAPHRSAALLALRALTGHDAEPTAKAWRAVLAE